MAMVRKKQDDKYLEALRELITTGGGNRQCFDCGQKGPTYVNMTIGSFVCTRCSGVLRGLTPPHRVKSISMATFTQDEIDFLKAHGNDVCAKTWLGLWDPKRAVHQDQRELMIDKYERKRYYLEPASPLKSLTNATNLKTSSSTAGATTTISTVSSGSATSNNNRSNSNNTHNSSSNNNNNHHHTHIQLTPPTSQRTTANGLHKSSSSAISRPHHSGNSSGNSTTTSQQNGFNTDAFGLHNGLNLSVGSASTGALSDTSSCASANGFGAEADFVADFGSADIFNATVASSSPASSVGSSSTNNINNRYAKIQQPLRSSGGVTSAQQQFMNGNGNSFSSNGENFADFDHAPIYNAAGPNPLADIAEEPNYQFVRKNAVRKKSLRSESLTIKPNERQLKDILEMDNPMHYEDDGQQQQQDYIQFTPNESYLKATSDFNSIIEDFERFLTMNGHKYLDAGDQQQKGEQQAGGDFIAMMQAQQRQTTVNTSTTKFTPLALAAHATAMAVLGNQNHFNTPAPPPPPSTTTSSNGSNLMTSKDTSLNAQWDVWSLDGSSNTTSMRSNQPQMATMPAAWQTTTSLFDIKEEQQQQQTQQSIGMSLFSSNSNNGGNILNPSNTTTSFFATGPSTSATTNLIPTTATASSSASETKTGTSLPMSNGITINKNSTTNGFNNNNNNNSNASTSPAAPAADRYAALKDLDEQLRESKAVAAQAASIVTANVVESGFGNPTNGTVNPFAAHNPAVANPFQNNGNAPNATQLFGQMTLIPNGMVANGFLNGQKAQANAGFFNYTANGFATTNNNNNASNMNPTAVAAAAATTPGVPGATTMYSTGIPNGCGFGFGTMHQQQIAATGAGLTANAFNNPFAASGALNSNNPFL